MGAFEGTNQLKISKKQLKRIIAEEVEQQWETPWAPLDPVPKINSRKYKHVGDYIWHLNAALKQGEITSTWIRGYNSAVRLAKATIQHLHQEINNPKRKAVMQAAFKTILEEVQLELLSADPAMKLLKKHCGLPNSSYISVCFLYKKWEDLLDYSLWKP